MRVQKRVTQKVGNMTWNLGVAKWIALLTVVTCIRWVDITGDSGWVSKEEITEAAEITSCGILVKEDDEFLWLAMDASEDEEFNSTGVFPKGVILKRIDTEVDMDLEKD